MLKKLAHKLKIVNFNELGAFKALAAAAKA